MPDIPPSVSDERDGNTAPVSGTRTVFVVSPIGKSGTPEHRRAKLVLDFIIKKAFPRPGWTVVRADDEESPDSISTQVIRRIRESDLVVADLSGHNPNVFYEVAVAHGYERPIIHMITAGETMPFDIADQRAIFYELEDPESVDSAIKKMSASQLWLDGNPDRLRTPLSTYGAFTAISSTQPGSESNEAIAEALSEIVHRLGRLERRSIRRPEKSVPYKASIGGSQAPLTFAEVRRLIEFTEELDGEIAALKASEDLNDLTVQERLRELERMSEEVEERMRQV